jgi:hypothetical protein
VCVLALLAMLAGRPGRLSSSSKSAIRNPKSAIEVSYARLPLSFEANQGQTDGAVKFVSRGSGYTLFLTGTEAVLALNQAQRTQRDAPMERWRPAGPGGFSELLTPPGAGKMPALHKQATLRMRLVGANPKPEARGVEELPGKSNYFIGNDPSKWRTNVPTYAKVEYRDVYPGINLVHYGSGGQLEHDFVVAPGADPQQIKFEVEGAERIEIDAAGDLVMQLAGGEVRQHKPIVYQQIAGQRRDVPAMYRWRPAGRPLPANSGVSPRHGGPAGGTPAVQQIAFEIGPYDTGQSLVVDPVLVYSTYLGVPGDDYGAAIVVDSAGNAYVTGETWSTNFPTVSPLQPTYGGGSDAFVAKLNAAGSAVMYSTYLGGSGNDVAYGIAVDPFGSAYVTGYTYSLNFPTASPLQAAYGGDWGDAFVAKLNATGSALLYSTYLGGNGSDEGSAIAVDSAGNAYVTGYTASTNFPTASPLQAVTRGGGYSDAFVAKLNATGSTLVYSTYLGGSRDEYGYGIAVDSSGSAYVTGFTQSTNFPTASPLQATNGGGGSDAFVAKLNAAGSALLYSTYLGGSGEDRGNGIAVDPVGNAYLTGDTASANFPTLSALQSAFAGGTYDAFAAKLNAAGSALVYSTYLGGSGEDRGYAIAVDSVSNAYLTGWTDSSNFPTASPVQSTNGGVRDVFVAKLDATGSALIYSTYLGGSGYDYGEGIALDSAGNVYAAGYTSSANFPVANALQPVRGGGDDVFIAKISESNDNSANARAITALPYTDTVSTSTATTETSDPTPTCGGGKRNNTVWYKYTPAASGSILVDTFGSNYDTVLSAWTGSPGSLTQVACNDDTGGQQSQVVFNVTAGATYYFMVSTGGSGGTLVFHLAADPTPAITSLSPTHAPSGSSALTLTISGSGFNALSVVRWSGSDRTTTLVSSTSITASIPASDLAAAGTSQVTVRNLGGGVSNALTFTIDANPTPAITSLSPNSATAGTNSPVQVTVTGSGFTAASVVRWNGSGRTTLFTSSTELSFLIPVTDMATAGTAQVTVYNPPTGGGTSGAQTFTVNNPSPTISGLSPSSAGAGGAGFTLTVNGTNFVSGAVVNWNGSARTTTFVSATQLTAAIPAADVAAAGTGLVTVVNPPPSAGPSAGAAFTIKAITSLVLVASPNPSTLGQAVTLTATVSPASATGKVMFYDGVTALGTSTLSSGQATLTTALLPSGGRSLKAYYGGDATFLPSTSAGVAQTVAAAPQNGFLPAVNYNAGSGPFSVAVGDFNGDGKADLAMANSGSSNVSVLLGNGNGTFQAAVNYNAGTGPVSVAVGDFNGDGKADLAAANQFSNTVSVLLGNGDGTFQAAVNYNAGTAPDSVAVGDFNGDGKADLAVANYDSNNVSVLLGNGDGTFQAAVNYGAGTNPESVAVGDFNGDGKADLAVANSQGANVSVLLGSGDGTFQAAVNYNAGSVPASVAVGDFNGDGKADLAPANENGANVSVLLGNGNGTFQAAVNYGAGVNPYCAAVGDFNGDGEADLAVANYGGNNVSVLLGNGNGTFQAAVNYSAGTGPISAAVGDFNGDGRADLATANSGSNNVSILLGAAALPDLAITKTHTGNFMQGQTTGAAYAITVSNVGLAATSGTVTFTDTLPAGLTATAISGTGWVCTLATLTCLRTDALAASASYPAITLTVSVASNAAVSVANTATVSGGGESNTANDTASDPTTINVLNPVPALTSLSPSSATAGGAAFTLTVNGVNFVSGATVRWNGTERTTTYGSATQLTATIPAADIVAAGTAQVTVFNPAPGGGASNALTFTINPPPTPAAIVKVSGDGQSGQVGTTLGNPLVVEVRDGQGAPLAGVTVNFAVTGGGASLSPATGLTGATGQAQTVVTLGTTATTITITASVTGVATPATFTLTATPGPAASLSIVAGTNQAAVAGSTLPLPLVVRLADQYSNPISGASVNFSVTGGGGTLSAASATTNTSGQAQVSWTLGAVEGPNTTRASVASLSPVVFAATGLSAAVTAGWVTPVSATGPAGGEARIPITLTMNSGVSVDGLAFGLKVEPNGTAPALSGQLSFVKEAAMAEPALTDAGLNTFSVGWMGLVQPLEGTVRLGEVVVPIPSLATDGQTYTVRITGASGSRGTVTVTLLAGANAAISVVGRTYLVGDAFPLGSDLNGDSDKDDVGEFGDSTLEILDLIYALRAVTSVPGYRPPACSDRFDAIDSHPADTPTVRGGNATLNTVDLIYTLRRVTNVDTSRPRRYSRSIQPCTAGAGPQLVAQAVPSGEPAARLQLGSPEPVEGGAVRIPVYLEAGRDLELAGLSFSLRLESGKVEPGTWNLEPGTAPPPTLVDPDVPGVLSIAWLEGLQVAAGQRLLLGYVVAPGLVPGTLRFHGVSASAPDGSEVRVSPPAPREQM